MRIELVPSTSYNLGPLEPDWARATERENINIIMRFLSRHDGEKLNYTGKIAESFLPDDLFDNDIIDHTEERCIVDAMTPAAVTIDKYYREFRGIAERENTVLNITYRRGSARFNSVLGAFAVLPMNIIGASHVGFVPGGVTHRDVVKDHQYDEVLVCHKGRSTIVFEGPLPIIKTNLMEPGKTISSLLNGKFGRLFGSYAYHIPHDSAILINEGTLHKQAAQWWLNRDSVGSFLRAFIRVEKNEE